MVSLGTISTGLSIAGKVAGLFGGDGRSSKDESNARSRYIRDGLAATREGAERAGFNPLTALSSGAMSLASGGLHSQGTPFSQRAEGALGGIGTVIDDHVRRQSALEVNEANIQLAQIQSDKLRAGGAGETFMRTRNAMTYQPGQSGPSVLPTSDPLTRWEERTKDVRDSQRDLKTPYGTWEVDEDFDSAQMIEDEYSDAVGWAYGVGKIAHDAGKNVRSYLGRKYGGMFLDQAPSKTFKPLHIEVK